MTGRPIWIFEFKGYLASLADEVQFGYASEDYSRRPADTGLALGFYAGRLERPGDFRQVMFSDGRTGGRSQVSRGEIVLANASRLLDNLRFFAFDGRDAKLLHGLIGDDGALVAGSLRTVLEFQIERPVRDFNRVRFTIVDRQAEFARRPMQPVKFAGDGPANDVNAEPGTAVFDGNLIGSINGTPVGDVTDAVTNFDARNDRKSTTPADPVIATGGTAVDHVVNTDGSVDISLEWTFTGSGDAYDIDGFLVYVRSSTSSSAYVMGTTAAEETVLTLPADKRAMILTGVPANKYFTFGVQAYRRVDPDIDASEILKSAIVQPSESSEDPYRPSSSVAFSGSITGTIAGASDAGNLATKDTVNYPEIVPNAATHTLSDSSGATGVGNSYANLCSVDITTQGGPLLIIYSGAVTEAATLTGKNAITLLIQVDGVTLVENNIFNMINVRNAPDTGNVNPVDTTSFSRPAVYPTTTPGNTYTVTASIKATTAGFYTSPFTFLSVTELRR